jgi:CheY-like chemotaxis protein
MERTTVLVVDDREIDRKLVDRALTGAGYEVTTAVSGEEGIELIRSRLFDAAIVYLRMPRMDGIELLRLIKTKAVSNNKCPNHVRRCCGWMV